MYCKVPEGHALEMAGTEVLIPRLAKRQRLSMAGAEERRGAAKGRDAGITCYG
jgi:hypothetical protein